MQRIEFPIINEKHPSYEALQNAEKYIGFAMNDGMLMSHSPEITSAFEKLTMAILSKGTVDTGLKRLMGLISSLSAGCMYCASHTSYSANKLGIEKVKIEAIWNYKNSPLFSPKEKAALQMASRAGMVPNQVEDSDFIELKKHFSNPEIVELVSVISLYGYLNRFNSTLATKVETEPKTIFESLKKEHNE